MADVLVVDDDAAIRGLLRSVLKREGHVVDEAENGVDALEKMHAHRYAAVLLDLMMPRMNGWEVLDELAREDEKLLECVIVLSAAVPKKDLPQEQRALIHALLAKPFDLQDLLVTIRDCVDSKP